MTEEELPICPNCETNEEVVFLGVKLEIVAGYKCQACDTYWEEQ